HRWWMPASERHSHSGPKEQVAAAGHGASEDSFCSDDSQKWRCSCCHSRFGIYSVAHAKAPTVQGTGEEVANATGIRDCSVTRRSVILSPIVQTGRKPNGKGIRGSKVN